ncbi:MAG: hypothetical protein B1H03_00685 [Planctomycetales bacterium 4484_113]|nr:MAG: hypothetical protein B1H03_00685 [Planctomycetales bacterium 4484_113]
MTTVNGIEIRPMGEDFVLSLCPQILLNGPLDRDDPAAFQGFVSQCPHLNQQFFQRQIAVNGTCAILAWDQHQLVGAVLFLPEQEVTASIGKVIGDESYPEEWWKSLQKKSPSLVATCFTVAKGYRGMGIARGLAQTMIDWARKAKRWRAIVVPGVQTEIVGYNHRMGLPFWERLGFKIVRVNDRASLQPGWAAQMKNQIMRKQEMGAFMVEGIDFSLLLRKMGWDGLLASYDMELRLSERQ